MRGERTWGELCGANGPEANCEGRTVLDPCKSLGCIRYDLLIERWTVQSGCKPEIMIFLITSSPKETVMLF